jgi:CHAT domain-containing protein
MPTDVHQFKSHAYLLKKHAMSYAFSASFLHEILSNPTSGHASRGLLSVAPSFANNPYGLMPLRYNIPEAAAVSKQFGGKALLGSEATLTNFLTLAPQYRILHLATHGKAAPTQSDYSFLAFSLQKGSTNQAFLYARDLYNLKLPCELVVLSACETGVGAFQHGEGIIGLSRGFFYAGARSLTTTLWSVDDARTSALVEQFFSFLKKGLPKDKALQAAKLDYLSRRPHDEAHPFYWAGVAVYGSIEPLRSSAWLFWVVGGLILAISLGFGLYWRRKKRSKM